jgi:hypothetical protein
MIYHNGDMSHAGVRLAAVPHQRSQLELDIGRGNDRQSWTAHLTQDLVHSFSLLIPPADGRSGRPIRCDPAPVRLLPGPPGHRWRQLASQLFDACDRHTACRVIWTLFGITCCGSADLVQIVPHVGLGTAKQLVRIVDASLALDERSQDFVSFPGCENQ